MGHEETDARVNDHTRGRFADAATFGAFLRNRRESQNLSLRDVAGETKIAERYLAALEHGDVRSWPGGIYRRGMVRAYATAVGLDPDSTVREFADAFNEAPAQTLELERSPAPPGFDDLIKVRPHATLCVGLALCAAIAVFTWAVPSSNAAGAIATNQIDPVAAVGNRADAAAATATSGAPSGPSATLQTPPEPTTVTPAELITVTSPPLTTAPVAKPATATPLPSNPTPAPASPADETPAPASTDGSMQILSEPAGAQVTVNGIQWGQTPVTIRYLEPGEKLVRLTKDGYSSAERRLVLTPEQPTQEVMVSLASEQ
jgi:cytoskeletal protein RodZ